MKDQSSPPATSGNGRRSMEVIRPETWQAVTLDDISVSMRNLLTLMRSQIPEGEAPFLRVADVGTVEQDVGTGPPAWHSVRIWNDGQYVLEVRVNGTHQGPIEVRPGEDHVFDFQAPVVEYVSLRAQEGTVDVLLEGTR